MSGFPEVYVLILGADSKLTKRKMGPTSRTTLKTTIRHTMCAKFDVQDVGLFGQGCRASRFRGGRVCRGTKFQPLQGFVVPCRRRPTGLEGVEGCIS